MARDVLGRDCEAELLAYTAGQVSSLETAFCSQYRSRPKANWRLRQMFSAVLCFRSGICSA